MKMGKRMPVNHLRAKSWPHARLRAT